jgi:type II secretory pathway component PulL
MDPYAEKEGPWKAWLVLFLLAALVLVLWLQGYLAAWWKLIG